jgi:hypothetical protein
MNSQMGGLGRAVSWIDAVVLGLVREFRLSYLPPLMVYVAAGISGLTAIVGVFFIKDYLGLSAAFLAGLGFWAGIPWVLKMPLGHLVDLMWRFKGLLVFLGALLIGASLMIMYGLIAHTEAMGAVLPVEVWFVSSFLLAPVGYVIQDVVADAMTVEAVPRVGPDGVAFDEAELKAMHTTMQMLGRVAIIGGGVLVALLNIYMFAGIQAKPPAVQAQIYGNIYLIALGIPVISVAGVIAGIAIQLRHAGQLRAAGLSDADVRSMVAGQEETAEPDWTILGGSLAFVIFMITIGLADLPFAQEITFAGAMAIVIFLIVRLMRALEPAHRLMLTGTAIIIFVFRAMPTPGPGVTWWEIDVLGFDQQFLSILTLIASGFTLAGMLVLRRYMASRSIADIVIMLTVLVAFMALPNVGMFYGLHEWTAARTGGVVDARFIAIADTALESPLYQIAMVPMLAWIAQNAPAGLKATFFAVFASFTNLALSLSQLGTKYLNQIFVIQREVRDKPSGRVKVAADYDDVGVLLIAVLLIGLLTPLVTVLLVQRSRLRTRQ